MVLWAAQPDGQLAARSSPLRDGSDGAGSEQARRCQSGIAVPLTIDLLRRGMPVRLEVGGHSMTPFIRCGDVITLHPRADQRPCLGDVLAVASEGRRLTVHRHVGWSSGRVVLRGDATVAPDAAVPIESVLGVVAGVTRGAGRAWAALGPERRIVAWLSRVGVLGRIAIFRAHLKRRLRALVPLG
jgi:hypothetical protein